ncbi:MBL fold metallo-hydrolase [Microbaculum marinum]|uniref:MBL fold metallo-hydrolase n=1 Tax=Microbaculum marinum TaxID=1764581 RepID=A0AAW9RNE3_9HYPH
MTDAADMQGPPPPTVDPTGLKEIAAGVWIIDDKRVPLVPNIGIVAGSEAVLVVDTGMGPANGAKVLEAARRVAGDRRLILTLTHFHPEHGYGAQAFRGEAEIFYNAAQRDELAQKGAPYLGMFKTFGPAVAEALEGTEIVMPDRVYEGRSAELDLGGRTVEFRTWGLAHTKGDQIVWLPAERVLFTGDLAEERIFPIFPWFPPEDADLDAARWVEILSELEALDPAIVVPGHGDIGGPSILSAVRGYMVDLAARVGAERKAGKDADTIVRELAPVIRSEHPDWDAPEWIDFAIRYYATVS